MKPKLIGVFLLIVLLPLGLLAWLGIKLAQDERTRVQQRFRDVFLGRLSDISAAVSKTVERHQRELLKVVERPPETAADTLREVARGHRLVRQLFVLAPDGSLRHPLRGGELTADEAAFFERTRSVWESGEAFYRPGAGDGGEEAGPDPPWGWHTWFWGDGLNFFFWRRAEDGSVVGAEVESVAVQADVVAALPAPTAGSDVLTTGRVALSDARDEVLYQWGDYRPGKDEEPQAVLAMGPPLRSWTLRYHAPGQIADELAGPALFNIVSGLTVLGVALVVLSAYFYRESAREIRAAAQRVSFVNQVSHELKTPLTNIRLYAELLEDEVEDEGNARRHLAVVVEESQRLSRLITNVLTFARSQREDVAIHPQQIVADDVVEAALQHFAPAFSAAGVAVEFSRGAPGPSGLDPDALEQILGNLFGNVEKYAAGGRYLRVATAQGNGRLTIEVSDRGPGVAPEARERIFLPFERLSDKLSDGVTGTGIGLAIARDLARLHGGDVTCQPAGPDGGGATFTVELKVKGPGEGV